MKPVLTPQQQSALYDLMLTTAFDETARGADLSMAQCDDCHDLYRLPYYYSFDVDACKMSNGNGVHEHNCTGSLCPKCTGPFITPDDSHDPRFRALLLDYHQRQHVNQNVFPCDCEVIR